jgi:dihydropyrimidinase
VSQRLAHLPRRWGWTVCGVVTALVTSVAAQQTPELIIRNGLVVTDAGRSQSDLRIRNGTIAEIAPNLSAPAGAREIDARGMLVLPGGIDPHTHLLEAPTRKGDDDYSSASRAALAGGITTIGNFIHQVAGEELATTLDKATAVVRQQAIADVILHVRAHTLGPVKAPLPTAEDLRMLADRGYSMKFYLIRPEFDQNAADYLRFLFRAGEAGLLTMIHCEDLAINTVMRERLIAEGHTAISYVTESQPVVSEEVAVQRAVAMSEVSGAPIYLVHMTSERALQVAEAAMARGLPVYVETRILYLHLTKERFSEPEGGIYTGNPPMKGKRDQDALWAGIAKGTVHVVDTDHIGFTREEKLNPPPTIRNVKPAGNYLQENLPLLYSEGVRTGRITLERFVEVTSTNPAKLFGLYPRKGTIAVGSDADVAIWNPNLKHTIRDGEQLNNGNFSVFAGWEVMGWPTVTIRRGEVVYQDGKIIGSPGSGQLAPRHHWQKLTQKTPPTAAGRAALVPLSRDALYGFGIGLMPFAVTLGVIRRSRRAGSRTGGPMASR